MTLKEKILVELAWHFRVPDPSELRRRLPTRVLDVWIDRYLKFPPQKLMAMLVSGWSEIDVEDLLPIYSELEVDTADREGPNRSVIEQRALAQKGVD